MQAFEMQQRRVAESTSFSHDYLKIRLRSTYLLVIQGNHINWQKCCVVILFSNYLLTSSSCFFDLSSVPCRQRFENISELD